MYNEDRSSEELSFEVLEEAMTVTAIAAHPTCSNALVEDLFDGE